MTFLYFILPALGGYTLASLYLLKHPHVLHKRKRNAFFARHISHRGGCGERIESTMEAFTNAAEQGTQMFELDCHLTQDGHVVVSHDENLLRQTGRDVTISSLDLQDLPLYKEKLEVTFNQDVNNQKEIRFLTCESDMQTAKSDVSELVKRYDRDGITVWASLSSSIMKKCVKANDAMPYSFSMMRGVLLLLLFYSGLLPFVPLKESLLQFYLPRVMNRTFIPEQRILRNKTVVCLLEIVTMRKSLFKHLADRGIQVHLFVCNRDEDIKAALELGATGVMTDYPSLLTNYILKNNKLN